jgi:cold shock CspA family protein
MPTGTVKWFNEDEAGKDLFVHQSGVAADGPLKEGARVSFDTEQDDKGPRP